MWLAQSDEEERSAKRALSYQKQNLLKRYVSEMHTFTASTQLYLSCPDCAWSVCISIKLETVITKYMIMDLKER
jgi:hypothetical protein